MFRDLRFSVQGLGFVFRVMGEGSDDRLLRKRLRQNPKAELNSNCGFGATSVPSFEVHSNPKSLNSRA